MIIDRRFSFGVRPATTEEASIFFWSRTKKTGTGCWEWAGYRTAAGYGQLTENGVQKYAHRTAWEKIKGPIPDGLFIIHVCDNPPCINPNHLRAATPQENSKDMVSKSRDINQNGGKPFCIMGHAFSETNTYLNKKYKKRSCKKCAIRRQRIRRGKL